MIVAEVFVIVLYKEFYWLFFVAEIQLNACIPR